MVAEINELVKRAAVLVVVAYYRMSSDPQETSIEQQRKECRAHARRNGWLILREYIDSGKSGSKEIAKRVEFHRMIADSAAGDFSAVLCYHTSRFGRLDSQHAAQYKLKLRNNGVHLQSVIEGKIDWSTSMGRMQDAMLSEANHEYSQTLSKSSIRGRMHMLESGWCPTGSVPYGYDRAYYVGEVLQQIVPRTAVYVKPGNNHLKLAINDSAANVVRWIFNRFATNDVSLNSMAHELTQRGHTPPGGGKAGWTKNTIQAILKQRKYIGEMGIGTGKRTDEVHNRTTTTVVKNGCPVIVDRATFDVVQQKLDARKASKRKPRRNQSGALTGVLICGHCGYRMDRHVKHQHGKEYIRYSCSSAVKRPALGCHNYSVNEATVLDEVCDTLVQAIDWKVLETLQHKPAAALAVDLEPLKQQAIELAAKVSRATENLLMVSPDNFALAQDKLTEWKADLERVKNTITIAESKPDEEAHERMQHLADAVKAKMIHIRFPVAGGDIVEKTASGVCLVELTAFHLPVAPETLRDLLHRLNCTVTLSWVPNGKRYFSLSKGIMNAHFGESAIGVGNSSTANSGLVVHVHAEIDFKAKGLTGALRYRPRTAAEIATSKKNNRLYWRAYRAKRIAAGGSRSH